MKKIYVLLTILVGISTQALSGTASPHFTFQLQCTLPVSSLNTSSSDGTKSLVDMLTEPQSYTELTCGDHVLKIPSKDLGKFWQTAINKPPLKPKKDAIRLVQEPTMN